MKKWIQLIAMVLAVIMLAGCNLIATDQELNAKQTVLEIGDQRIAKAELFNAWANAMDEMAYMYQMYGLPFDTGSADNRQYALDQAIETVITKYVLQQKGESLNLDQFSDEDLAELDPDVQRNLDSYAWQVQTQYFADTELEGDELTDSVNAKLEEMGITREDLLESVKKTKIAERVRQVTIQDVTVTPEEVEKDYQAKVDAQKDSYGNDITAYASDMMNSQDIYFVPDGYRYVKHVLLKIDDVSGDAIGTLESELSALRTSLTNLQTSIAGLAPEDGAEQETEEEAAARAETETKLGEELAQTEADIAAKETELEAASTDAFSALLPKVQEVQAKLDLGLNFDKVIDSYGEDSGMGNEPFKTMGYPVIDGLAVYDQAFQDAAMELSQLGDISDPVKSSFGYHLIKYVGDSFESEIGLDAVSEKLSDSLLSAKQEEVYETALAQWIDETKVKRYDKRIDFM